MRQRQSNERFVIRSWDILENVSAASLAFVRPRRQARGSASGAPPSPRAGSRVGKAAAAGRTPLGTGHGDVTSGVQAPRPGPRRREEERLPQMTREAIGQRF